MTTVTLDVTINGNYLDVSQHGNGPNVAPNTNVTIKWHLTGNAASGKFNALPTPENPNPVNPGFSWIKQPPAGIFSAPALGGDDKEISLTDSNGSNPLGAWTYRLCATIGGKLYSTDPSISNTAARMTTSSMTVDLASNPTIQNR